MSVFLLLYIFILIMKFGKQQFLHVQNSHLSSFEHWTVLISNANLTFTFIFNVPDFGLFRPFAALAL